MPIMNMLFLAFSLYIFATPNEGVWKVTKKNIQKNTTTITSLQFTKGRKRQIYTPERKSLWVLDIEEIKVGEKQYFATAWSQGGRTLLFRIFDPEISNSPICDAISFGEKTQLRIHQGHLQLKIFNESSPGVANPTSKSFWRNCRKIN